MKQCPNCKITYPDDQAFCTDCGTALVDAAPPPPPPQPVQDTPTIPVPPISQPAPVQPQAPASPAPVKKSKGAMVAAIILAVCTLLAAGCAGFAGYEAIQFKKNYESEQALRASAEQEAADVQEQLDKLQLDHDKTADQLKESNAQLEDARSQLEEATGQLTDGSSRLDEVEAELSNLISMLDWGYGFGSTDYYASKGVVVVSPNSSETVSIYENMAGSTTFSFDTPDYGMDCTWNGSFSNGWTTVTITGREPGYYTLPFSNDYNSDYFEILVIVTQ